MDSANSGSIQSSSTGGGTDSRGGREDQEFESRSGETISALLNPTSFASFDNPAAASQLYSLNDGTSFSAYHHQHQVPNYKFDPPTFSQSMMINHNNNNNNNNNSNNSNIVGNDNSLGLLWPNKYTSIQPSPTNTYSFSVDDDANNCISSATKQQFNTCATQSHQMQRPPLPVSSSMELGKLAKSSPGSLNQQGSGGSGRSNPKKRSRASRRTPTTVLTTDTNNFRQMVQEFTGIPSSPFETAFARRARLDLFGGFGIQLPRGSEGVIANNGSSMLDVCSSTMQPPHLMIRPFSQNIIAIPNNNQKVTTPSFLPRPSSVTAVEKFHVSGFRQGDPTISLGSKANDSLMHEFALGHNNISTATTTTTTTCARTTCSAIGRHQVNSVDGGGNNNVSGANLAMENQGGVTRGEATVESWICSSD